MRPVFIVYLALIFSLQNIIGEMFCFCFTLFLFRLKMVLTCDEYFSFALLCPSPTRKEKKNFCINSIVRIYIVQHLILFSFEFFRINLEFSFLSRFLFAFFNYVLCNFCLCIFFSSLEDYLPFFLFSRIYFLLRSFFIVYHLKCIAFDCIHLRIVNKLSRSQCFQSKLRLTYAHFILKIFNKFMPLIVKFLLF